MAALLLGIPGARVIELIVGVADDMEGISHLDGHRPAWCRRLPCRCLGQDEPASQGKAKERAGEKDR